MFALCFKPKLCYIHFQYFIGHWRIIFQKSKRPWTHLFMSFRALSIWLVISFYHKIFTCRVTGNVCFMFQAKALLVLFTFNLLLVTGKSIFRSQKYLRPIYFWASVALVYSWIYILINKVTTCRVTGDAGIMDITMEITVFQVFDNLPLNIAQKCWWI